MRASGPAYGDLHPLPAPTRGPAASAQAGGISRARVELVVQFGVLLPEVLELLVGGCVLPAKIADAVEVAGLAGLAGGVHQRTEPLLEFHDGLLDGFTFVLDPLTVPPGLTGGDVSLAAVVLLFFLGRGRG